MLDGVYYLIFHCHIPFSLPASLLCSSISLLFCFSSFWFLLFFFWLMSLLFLWLYRKSMEVTLNLLLPQPIHQSWLWPQQGMRIQPMTLMTKMNYLTSRHHNNYNLNSLMMACSLCVLYLTILLVLLKPSFFFFLLLHESLYLMLISIYTHLFYINNSWKW